MTEPKSALGRSHRAGLLALVASGRLTQAEADHMCPGRESPDDGLLGDIVRAWEAERSAGPQLAAVIARARVYLGRA